MKYSFLLLLVRIVKYYGSKNMLVNAGIKNLKEYMYPLNKISSSILSNHKGIFIFGNAKELLQVR